MEIEVKLDPQYKIPKVIVLTDKLTEEVNELVKRISEEAPNLIAGFCEDTLQLLEPQEIIRIYTNGKHVSAVTDSGEFILRQRLYEMEERLGGTRLVRISNSEIINLSHAKNFDLSIAGTICVKLSDGTTTYVSRRYVSKIKRLLGI